MVIGDPVFCETRQFCAYITQLPIIFIIRNHAKRTTVEARRSQWPN